MALQEAHACGARICFGDRPVQVPLHPNCASPRLCPRIKPAKPSFADRVYSFCFCVLNRGTFIRVDNFSKCQLMIAGHAREGVGGARSVVARAAAVECCRHWLVHARQASLRS